MGVVAKGGGDITKIKEELSKRATPRACAMPLPFLSPS
jgi:hypothetical protein